MASKTKNAKRAGVSDKQGLRPLHIFLAFAGIFSLNLLLRVFYLRYDFVNGDEGVRALTATRVLEGARLYADVLTDKPPGATLFYAAVFALFGRSMKAVHLAAAVWNFVTSIIIYLIAARFSGRRTGLWAATLFVYFSTNYLTQDMMAANTELLMAVPYTAAFYFFLKAQHSESHMRDAASESARLSLRPAVALVAAGLMTGLAAMFKQTGVLNLGFFAMYEACKAYGARSGYRASRYGRIKASVKRSLIRLSLVALGFIAALATLLAWLAAMGSVAGFWSNAIVLSKYYIDSDPAGLWLKFIVGRGLGYVFFNATLWALAAWVIARSIRRIKRGIRYADGETKNYPPRPYLNLAVALWGAASLSSVMISGRFFGHYFIPVLPALSLLAADAVELLRRRMRNPVHKRAARMTVAILGLFFSVGFARAHHRTVILAYETLTGARTRWSEQWGMTERQREAEAIAESLRGKIGEGEPLYIWGYAHDVYWRTGCRPASRYLAPYYIDGRFPDAEAKAIASNDPPWSEARDNLIEDLRRSRPRLILDVYGSIKQLPHPKIVDFIKENYREGENIGPDPSRPFLALWLKGE
ncbi:MAG TPA: glycosyltransferase family 39 protein [Blastocatellia bacterium]